MLKGDFNALNIQDLLDVQTIGFILGLLGAREFLVQFFFTLGTNI